MIIWNNYNKYKNDFLNRTYFVPKLWLLCMQFDILFYLLAKDRAIEYCRGYLLEGHWHVHTRLHGISQHTHPSRYQNFFDCYHLRMWPQVYVQSVESLPIYIRAIWQSHLLWLIQNWNQLGFGSDNMKMISSRSLRPHKSTILFVQMNRQIFSLI